MRLLAYTENFLRGGGNRYLVDILNSVAPLFEGVELMANQGGLYAEDLARLRAPVERGSVRVWTTGAVEARWAASPRVLRRLVLIAAKILAPLAFAVHFAAATRAFRRSRPDFFWAFAGGYPGGRSVQAWVVAAGRLRIPCVLSVVSTPLPPARGLAGLWDRWVDRAVGRAASCVVVNSKSIWEAMVGLRHLPRKLGQVVYNGLEDRVANAPSTGAIRTIGYVGRIETAKGARDLAQAFAQIANEYPEVRLKLVGEGDAFTELRAFFDAQPWGARVEMPGYWPGDASALLGALDGYIFPSHHEGFPYSLLEAMRAGLPIVATRVGGIPEAIEDGRHGLLVEPRRPDLLAAAIREMISQPAKSREMGRAARARFVAEFTLAAMEQQAQAVVVRRRETP